MRFFFFIEFIKIFFNIQEHKNIEENYCIKYYFRRILDKK
jgi:hypothetical protein